MHHLPKAQKRLLLSERRERHKCSRLMCGVRKQRFITKHILASPEWKLFRPRKHLLTPLIDTTNKYYPYILSDALDDTESYDKFMTQLKTNPISKLILSKCGYDWYSIAHLPATQYTKWGLRRFAFILQEHILIGVKS